MDITLTEEVYIPSFCEGKYIDEFPETQKAFSCRYAGGLLCQCSGKIYESRESFKNHVKTKLHKKWLDTLVQSETNPLRKAIELEKVVKNQQKIIVSLSNEKQQLLNQIDLFFSKRKDSVGDLIEF